MSDEPDPFGELPNGDSVEVPRQEEATGARLNSMILVLIQWVTFLGIVGVLLLVVPEKIRWFEEIEQDLSPLQVFVVSASFRATRYWYVIVPLISLLFLGELGMLQLIRNIRPLWWAIAILVGIPLAFYVIALINFMIMS